MRWLRERLTSALDSVIGFFIGGALATIFFVQIVAPAVETRIIERINTVVREVIATSGVDVALIERIHRYLDAHGIPR
mgnify:CR=1 FL=1